jgi:hypothetical protein
MMAALVLACAAHKVPRTANNSSDCSDGFGKHMLHTTDHHHGCATSCPAASSQHDLLPAHEPVALQTQAARTNGSVFITLAIIACGKVVLLQTKPTLREHTQSSRRTTRSGASRLSLIVPC